MNPGKALAFALLFLVSMPFCAKGAEPVWEWVKLAGGAGADEGSGVAVDADGRTYFAGRVTSGRIGAAAVGNHSLFWTVVSESGEFSTTKLGQTSSPNARGAKLAIGADQKVVSLGIFSFSINYPQTGTSVANSSLLTVFNSDLTVAWSRPVGAAGFLRPPFGPAIAPNGDIIITSAFVNVNYQGTELSGTQNSQDMLLLRVTSSGNLVWMKKAGGTWSDFATSVAVDSDGSAFAAGAFDGTFSVGQLTLSGNGTYGVVSKLGTDGGAVWAKSFPTTEADRRNSLVLAVATDAAGNVFVGGLTNGGGNDLLDYERDYRTGLFVKLSSQGTQLWSKSFGTLSIYDLETDSNGDIYVLGSFFGTLSIDGRSFSSRGVSDIFVGKFSTSGALIWGKQCGGPFLDIPGQLALGPGGSVLVAGTISENGTFSPHFVEGSGQGEAFIAKLSDPNFSQLPEFSRQVAGINAFVGGTASFAVEVLSTVPVSYQWYLNGVAITGKTAATLNLESVRPEDAGSYYVEVTNEYGTVRSEAVRLVVAGEAPVSVTTLAGGGANAAGFVDNSNGALARFFNPDSLAVQNDGVIIVPDAGNNAVRLVEAGGATGTLAGKGPAMAGLENGPASAALFFNPIGVAVAPSWDVFVADGFNHVVRRISAFGVRSVTTWAGTGVEGFANGPGAQAQFQFPNDLVTDEAGNVFVTEFRGHRVRRISTDGMVTTVAGTGVAGYQDGAGGQAQFNGPAGIARDAAGNLYVTEWENDTIRKITPGGVVSTIAGRRGVRGFVDGPALTEAKLSSPNGIAVDRSGNIFFTEFGNSSVRRIDALGDVLTLVGTAGAGYANGGRTEAKMQGPGGIAVHPDGSLIVADTGNHAIRKVVWQANVTPTEAVVLIGLNPSITIFGEVGKTYRIEVTEDLVTPRWVVLGEVTLAAPVETWFDSQPATRGERYYRAVRRD